MTPKCKNSTHNVTPAFSVNYFSIIEQATGKALDATHEGDVILYTYHGYDNQLWSWKDVDKTILGTKQYNTKLGLTTQGV